MLLALAGLLSAGTIKTAVAQDKPKCKKECCKGCDSSSKEKCSKEECSAKCDKQKSSCKDSVKA